MDKLILPDDVWGRGSTGGSLLDTYQNIRKQCCLGVRATACGVPDEYIENMASPGQLYDRTLDEEVPDIVQKYVQEWYFNEQVISDKLRAKLERVRLGSQRWQELIAYNDSDTSLMMTINDAQDLTDEERFELLKILFAERGIELVWLRENHL